MSVVAQGSARAYWRQTRALVAILLAIWFSVSFGCGVLWVDALNRWTVSGVPLGFWIAQQGALYVFVAEIFVYVACMNWLDRRYDVAEPRQRHV